ncbi:transposase family protein [Streptomyces sp. NPDC002952]|uniref:helix-turn-helix domain-containing protein n=1 Tax=Streptomyces sp. NPDC002952 TaxID=3364673 RepID=UPI0036C273D8
MHLRHGATHDVLACWFGVDRSTITRAIGEVRPLLAERGCTVSAGVRLRTLAEVVDHFGAAGRPGSLTAPRSGSDARLSDARTGTSSSLRQEQAERRQNHGGHGRGQPRAVL